MIRQRAKPRVLLDCDEVLADTTTSILEYINANTGKSFVKADVNQWDVFQAVGHPELDEQWRDDVDRMNLCLSIRPFVGAPRLIHELNKVSDVYVVTAPLDRCHTWCSQRYTWLERCFGIPRKRVVFAADKHLIEGDVFVDDKLDNVIDWKMAHPGGDALVFDQPWNRQGHHFYVSGRVYTHDDVLNAVLEWV